MFHFRFAVVYRPIYALGSILNLVFFFFFQYYVFVYRMNLVIFWLCFPIIYINHGRIGINTAFWGWLWPDIPSRDPQIITSNLRFSVIIWRSLDGISGHNHPKCSIYSLIIQTMLQVGGRCISQLINLFSSSYCSINQSRRPIKAATMLPV